ncbi:bestrophin family ion channel [Larkinella rosea]|uniref:bestrophin family ion channel n=1 Tax=Larkinella rosea TaxID=2025312 RepID=UPI00163B09E5|nr:bestrophin family ion channel [Larkinella rosea]
MRIEYPNELAIRLICCHLGFVHALKQSLRRTHAADYQCYLEPSDLTRLTRYTTIPAALLDRQAEDLQTLRQTGPVDGFAFLALNELLVRFSDSMGRCERIKNTLFPVTYWYFTRVFIWLLIVILTIDVAEEAGRWSIGLVSWVCLSCDASERAESGQSFRWQSGQRPAGFACVHHRNQRLANA